MGKITPGYMGPVDNDGIHQLYLTEHIGITWFNQPGHRALKIRVKRWTRIFEFWH